MTEERIAIVEKYLGSESSTGLLVQAWRDLRSALSNLHAALVLAHMTPDQVKERNRLVHVASQHFSATEIAMTAELIANERLEEMIPSPSNPGPGAEALLAKVRSIVGSVDVKLVELDSDYIAQANEPPMHELGGEG